MKTLLLLLHNAETCHVSDTSPTGWNPSQAAAIYQQFPTH